MKARICSRPLTNTPGSTMVPSSAKTSAKASASLPAQAATMRWGTSRTAATSSTVETGDMSSYLTYRGQGDGQGSSAIAPHTDPRRRAAHLAECYLRTRKKSILGAGRDELWRKTLFTNCAVRSLGRPEPSPAHTERHSDEHDVVGRHHHRLRSVGQRTRGRSRPGRFHGSHPSHLGGPGRDPEVE